jgi:hypothetical protein
MLLNFYLYIFNICLLTYTSYEYLNFINNLKNINYESLNNNNIYENNETNILLKKILYIINKFKLVNTDIWLLPIPLFIESNFTSLKIGIPTSYIYINITVPSNIKFFINNKEYIIKEIELLNIYKNINFYIAYINNILVDNNDKLEFNKLINLFNNNNIHEFNIINNDISYDEINYEINKYIPTTYIIINNLNKFLIISKLLKIPLCLWINININNLKMEYGFKLTNNYNTLSIGFENVNISFTDNMFNILVNNNKCIELSTFDLLSILNNKYDFNKQCLSLEEKEHIHNLLLFLKDNNIIKWINNKDILLFINNIKSVPYIYDYMNYLLLEKPNEYNQELILFELILKQELNKIKDKIIKKGYKNKLRHSTNMNDINDIITDFYKLI